MFQVATGVYRLHCTGDDLADPEAFPKASRLWMEQAKKKAADSDVRREAIRAIQFCEPEQAETLLIEGADRTGLGWLYASAALGITGESYVNNDSVGTDPLLRQSAFANKARKLLEEATDKDLVLGAVGTLLSQGANLWADGKLDWDYTVLGKSLLSKAQAMAPDEMRLLTLPTQLPARGERPPQTIRVGGAVQAANLVRTVAPPFPPAARDRGVQGTVRMTALIGLDGKILKLQVEGGPSELIRPSLAAVSQWEYKPTLLNGKPCYVITRIEVNFTLSQ